MCENLNSGHIQAQGHNASPYPRCWAATTRCFGVLFRAFCPTLKITGSTAIFSAQFLAFQFPLQTLASCHCQGLKICMCSGNTMLHATKLRILAKKYFNGSHWLYFCPQCSPGQRCAISGHREGIYRCPPAARLPCGCSGSPRARSAAVARHLHGCAQEAQRSRGGGCTAQQVAGCADGWCCEHRCHAGGVCVARERCVCATAHASQHAWNLHQHCTLAQVPLIDLKSILLKNFAKRIYFKITIFFCIDQLIWPFLFPR